MIQFCRYRDTPYPPLPPAFSFTPTPFPHIITIVTSQIFCLVYRGIVTPYERVENLVANCHSVFNYSGGNISSFLDIGLKSVLCYICLSLGQLTVQLLSLLGGNKSMLESKEVQGCSSLVTDTKNIIQSLLLVLFIKGTSY